MVGYIMLYQNTLGWIICEEKMFIQNTVEKTKIQDRVACSNQPLVRTLLSSPHCATWHSENNCKRTEKSQGLDARELLRDQACVFVKPTPMGIQQHPMRNN